MKLKKTIRRLDDALFQLQEAQTLLQAVDTRNGAQIVATAMQAPLEELLCILEKLMDKADKTA